MEYSTAGSPSAFAPGSPLTYSPQVAMEPLALDLSGGSGQAEFAGWASQARLVPAVLAWTYGGSRVQLEGSFDNWTQRHELQPSGRDFTLVKLLAPGVYQYKFVVDGQWRHDPNLPCVFDEEGNVNNVLEVQEYVPENLGSLSGFEPPPSPPESYTSPAPLPEDFAKEPPAMPVQLQLSLLNIPPALDALATLPRPQHVILNHAYLQRASASTTAVVLGCTHRHRAKYVTAVLYKPRQRWAAGAGAGPGPGASAPGLVAQQGAGGKGEGASAGDGSRDDATSRSSSQAKSPTPPRQQQARAPSAPQGERAGPSAGASATMPAQIPKATPPRAPLLQVVARSMPNPGQMVPISGAPLRSLGPLPLERGHGSGGGMERGGSGSQALSIPGGGPATRRSLRTPSPRGSPY